MSDRARLFVYSFSTIGIVGMWLVFAQWRSADPARFVILLVLGALGSRIKFKIPRAQSTVTAGMVVVLIAIVELSPAEAMAIALAGAAVQMFWKPQANPTLLQVLFNLAGFGISVSVTAHTYILLMKDFAFLSAPMILMFIGLMYLGLNTGPVAVILSLTGAEDIPNWRHEYGWMALFYVTASCLAGSLHLVTTAYGWQGELLALPILLMAGRTYQVFIGRIEDGQRHTDELQALQFRSIHTLALAVEAKDENTHAHLHRVRSYANALGRELGLKGEDLKALDAAAILHDIGKLAVPEHIIAKPGKLTPEEFDRMKIHTVVGSSIVEEMQFPYPVAPLVRGHHEKWDGSGYPDGLAGEAIPIGARILSAVDCLDAMASDRPYRRAMPLEKAMTIVCSESGKAYDPRIVDVLNRHYVALEAAARASLGSSKNVITANVHVKRGDAPATGFEVSAAPSCQIAAGLADTTDPIGKLQAALNVQTTVAALAEASAGISPAALAASLSTLIGRVLPHDSLVLFKLTADDKLRARSVSGVDADLLAELSVPMRHGLAGWVAHHREPIVNGDPAVETGAELWLRPTILRAALAAPLIASNRTVGVVGLYRRDKDSFNRSELGMLDLLTPRLSECLDATTELCDTAGSHAFLQQLERTVEQDGTPIVLVRLELDGNLSPEATEACTRAIREALTGSAFFVELRPNQVAVLSKRGSGGLSERLKAAAEEIFTRYGVRLAVGAATFAPGSSVAVVLADAERALAESKLDDTKHHGLSQSLLKLHTALTASAELASVVHLQKITESPDLAPPGGSR